MLFSATSAKLNTHLIKMFFFLCISIIKKSYFSNQFVYKIIIGVITTRDEAIGIQNYTSTMATPVTVGFWLHFYTEKGVVESIFI